MQSYWIILAAVLVVVGPIRCFAFGGDRITGRVFATRSEVLARSGMAATSQPLATQVALDILKQGGSAIDAAIAANATLGLMEPTGSGIGGDLFAIVWDAKTRKLYGLNASGRSPYGLTLDVFKNRGLKSIPPYGPLPVTIPGCVDGWFELHERFGKLPMSQVLAPAIRYAKEGFPGSGRLLPCRKIIKRLASWHQYGGHTVCSRHTAFGHRTRRHGRSFLIMASVDICDCVSVDGIFAGWTLA